MEHKLDNRKLDWITNKTNRSKGQTQQLFNLVDGDFDQLMDLEKQIKNCFVFYAPDSKEEIEKIMHMVPKTDMFSFSYLSDDQQLQTYIHYFNTWNAMSKDFEVGVKDNPKKGWGKPDKEVGNLQFWFPWKEFKDKIMTFDDFKTSVDNHSDQTFMENWYEKFKDKIRK